MDGKATPLSFSDYCQRLSEAFDTLSYSEIQYYSDDDAKLLIPSLSVGYVLDLSASQPLGNLFTDYQDYGCNIENRILSRWSQGILENVPFDKEEFLDKYAGRVQTIDEIKTARGLQQSNTPYWGVLVFTHGIPVLFHCQLEIDNKPLDTKELCLSLCREYDILACYNRYPIPNSEITIQQGTADFDWLYFHSLWWNSEDNAFIRYSLNVICKWHDYDVREELKRMHESYIEKAVREYGLHQEKIAKLNPEIESGIINDAIARYDWATHTLMLMESHKKQFVKDRKAKERVPSEELYYRTVQSYCKDVRLDYNGDAKPRFQGHGWTSSTLKGLFDYLIVSKNISSDTKFLDFCYYFGAEAFVNLEEPESRIQWIGDNKGLYWAFVNEFKDEKFIERSGTKYQEGRERHKDSQVSTKKLEQVLVISGDSTIVIGRKLNVNRQNTTKLNPYERSQKVLKQLKKGVSYKDLDVCKERMIR